ncbi:hypothetical protein AB0F72_36475 [Actinoplanes sp. NPDC023936]|uniref:hypothetical protein n=1 Tax=Actinoplanes sp. NPDC023936 TaxID=3154910 RepID=UPI0033DF94EE
MDWNSALARYADRLHAVAGGRHHVASPLGAWLLLALTAAAGGGDDLAEALGVAPEEAAGIAGALLAEPHPLVAAATAVWHAEQVDPAALAGWPLPAATTTGPLPGPAALDAWAREHTDGLIGRFPVEPAPDLLLLLGSALATRVSWSEPFETAPAAALGGEWASRLTRVLGTPPFGHRAFVTRASGIGDVIVHAASATGGLTVVSVAGQPDVPARRVLAAAYEIAPAVAARTLAPASLFDLPLGESPLWSIREEFGHDNQREHVRALLPAWSATSDHDLAADPGLGFSAATRVLGRLLGVAGPRFDAKQVATARYSRYGFEAAAVSGFGVATSFPPEGAIRHAELRFAHPYAVVAVTTQPGGPWDGVPVFSAWITEPDDTTD